MRNIGLKNGRATLNRSPRRHEGHFAFFVNFVSSWCIKHIHRSHALAPVVIHKCLRDTVVLAGMPEPRHREVKLRVT
jgi:hypothetical protein